MRINAIAQLSTNESADKTLSITQRTCGLSAAAQSAVLVPVLIAVIVPFVMLAAEAVAQPETLDRMTDAPVTTLSALTGVIVWAVMFGIPAWHALKRLGSKRVIEIADGTVSVTDQYLLGKRRWQAQLSEFKGVSHHQRTNLSGSRNELILVHDRKDRCLLLNLADEISQDETERMANRLGLRQLAPGAMFTRAHGLRLPTFQLPAARHLQRA
ncbi:MAG: hypothetical protein K0U74_07230 [Alphaproteobacteria bacterium]|nr:hypothetical protein [Alphaproteobacteria bacterium]